MPLSRRGSCRRVPRRRLRRLVVAAASFVIHAEATPSSQASEIQLQLGDDVLRGGSLSGFARRLSACAEDRAARRGARPRVPASSGGAARRGVRLARIEAEKLVASDPARPGRRSRCTATRCGRRVCSRKPRARTGTRWRRARPGARPPRHGAVARRAQPARRGDGRSAGGAAAVAARPRNPPHRRRDLRAHAQVRGGGRRLHATTSTCCRTRTTARRPTGRAPKSGSCDRSASACRSRCDTGHRRASCTRSTSGW